MSVCLNERMYEWTSEQRNGINFETSAKDCAL